MRAQPIDLELISEVKARWRSGEVADARGVLRNHPSLRQWKSVVIDLAYEEYCQRTEAGEEIDIKAFCRRFPSYSHSLYCRLEVEEMFRRHPSLAEAFGVPKWPQAGEQFAGFQLVQELGRGAIGRAFLAQELALSRRNVVVKLSTSGVYEAETLSRLQHPHIVPIYSVCNQDNLTAICMPYLGRWTLHDYLDVAFAGELPPDTFESPLHALALRDDEPTPTVGRRTAYIEGIVRMAAALCGALQHAHDVGIYHLDLKPSNVLITPEGKPLLLDFNLSYSESLGSSLGGGTLPYMSPEQIRAVIFQDAGSQPLDARSDLYSLGVIVLHLLRGTHPWGDLQWLSSSLKVAKTVLDFQRRGIEAVLPPVVLRDPTLVEILQKACAWDPAHRFASAGDMQQALEAWLSPRERARRLTRQHRRSLLVGGGCLALGMLGIGSYALSLEPYPVRLRQRGWKLYEEGRFAEARELFRTAANVAPDDAETWFGLGRTKQQLADYGTTFDDFRRAHELKPLGEYSACMGLCAAVLGRESLAIDNFGAALREGFETEGLLASLGCSYMRLPKLSAAESYLQLALRRNESFAGAWYALALVYFSRSLHETPEARTKLLQDASTFLMKAIRLGKETADTHITAAEVWYWLEGSPRRKEKIREHLLSAAHLGLSLSRLEESPLLSLCATDAQLMSILRKNPPRPADSILLFDPLGDDRVTRRAVAATA